MRILIATDAWRPQVNGVVRTLTSLARSASALGAEIDFLTPEGFPSVGLPTYPGLRVALPNRREIARRIEAASPDAIHIATEGPIGWAARAYCRRHKLAFTTSYTTRFPEYIAVRSIIPAALSYAVLRHFHAAAATTMVATASLHQELSARGFRKLGFWGRGVDTELFQLADLLRETTHGERYRPSAGPLRKLINLQPAAAFKFPFDDFRHGLGVRRPAKQALIPLTRGFKIADGDTGNRIADWHGEPGAMDMPVTLSLRDDTCCRTNSHSAAFIEDA